MKTISKTATPLLLLGAAFLAPFCGGPALAEDATSVSDIVVTGTRSLGVELKQPSTAGSRLGLTPLQTPASVAVVPGDLIRDLGIQTLAQAKSLAPGITTANNPGNGNNLLVARGFSGQNSVKQLFDGREIFNAGGVVSFPFDPFVAERIEVLYGPASVLYGTGAIGGAVNVVPRRPKPGVTRHELEVSAGAFTTLHAAFDANGALGDRLSYRVAVSGYRSDGFVDDGKSGSVAATASLRFDASDALRITLSNDFGYQWPQKYLGTPTFAGRPVPGLRSKNYNVADAALHFVDNWTTLKTEWQPAPNIMVENATFVLLHNRRYRDVTIFAYEPATAAKPRATVRRTSFRDISDAPQDQIGSTTTVRVDELLGTGSRTLIGFDVNRNFYDRDDNVRGGTSVVDALEPRIGIYTDFYRQESKPFYNIRVNQLAGFAEQRVQLGDRLAVVAGARADHYRVRREDEIVPAVTRSSYDSFGGNIGAVFNPTPETALYAQYAVASDPVSSLPSIGANLQAFSLSKGRQVEAGAKGSMFGGSFEWTFAAYRIVKNDLLTQSLVDPTLQEQVGRQSSKGIEAAVSYRTGPLRVDLNGTILKAQFDDFTTTVAGRPVSLAGNVPLTVPERAANARAFVDVTKAVQVRGALRYIGKRFADNLNQSVLPDYAVVDLGVRWLANPRLRLDLRLDNAFDATYAASGSTTQWILGTPRAVTLALNGVF